jgi:hypothetical protein
VLKTRQMMRALKAGVSAGYGEFRYHRNLAVDGNRGRVLRNLPRLSRAYLITTDKGIFALSDGALDQVSKIPAYGIAVVDDLIYVATWGEGYTTVVAADSRSFGEGGWARNWRELWRLPVASFAARVHQISVEGDALWLANTGQNCLTKLDRHSGRWIANIAPFECTFGHPIMADHNHINSVEAQPDYLLFAAFKINRNSVFGLCGQGQVKLFRYSNMGVHDCVFRGEEFLFSDSYGFWDKSGHGTVLGNGKPIRPETFKEHDLQFVRGIAGSDQELLVGNSFTGDRSTRFSGTGQLVVFRDNGAFELIDMPAAQIYDVIGLDGQRFPNQALLKSAQDVERKLQAVFGSPVANLPLDSCLVGERSKTFDSRDMGDVREYAHKSLSSECGLNGLGRTEEAL